jgi:hypothetical protein
MGIEPQRFPLRQTGLVSDFVRIRFPEFFKRARGWFVSLSLYSITKSGFAVVGWTVDGFPVNGETVGDLVGSRDGIGRAMITSVEGK